MRQLAELRRRLAAAETALEEAHAARKHAEEAYDAAADRFGAAEAAWTRSGRTVLRRAPGGMPPARRTSAPAPRWTVCSGGCASWPSAWTGQRS